MKRGLSDPQSEGEPNIKKRKQGEQAANGNDANGSSEADLIIDETAKKLSLETDDMPDEMDVSLNNTPHIE